MAKKKTKKSGHSLLGASSMYRWKACPGSVKLCKGVTSVPSPYAEEGTLAHKLAEAILNGTAEPKKGVTDGMREAVQVYVNFITDLWERTKSPGSEIFLEEQISIEAIHADLYGTADCIVYDAEQKLLHVIDYKHGAGIPVEVVGNTQLLYYGLGALHFLLKQGVEVNQVSLTIVQPRCEHPDGPTRVWRLPVSQLSDFAFELSEAVEAAIQEDAPLHSGEHCRFCPAAAMCPKKHEDANLAAKQEFTELSKTYDPKKLSLTLSKLDQIEDWVKSVREFAMNEARQGRTPPGYKLIETFGHRKWKDESSAIDFLVMCGFNEHDVFEKKMKSIAKIEKMLPKDQKGSFDRLTDRPSKFALVPEADPRAAVRIDAASDFDVVLE